MAQSTILLTPVVVGYVRPSLHSVPRWSADRTVCAQDEVQVVKAKTHIYGSFAAYCFSVNYILGVGVLGAFACLVAA